MVTTSILIIILSLHMATHKADTSFFDFTLTNIQGNEVSMNEYKGKVILIVNTASECGFTKQFDDLQKLYGAYKDDGFVILGFPSNNFGNQEPGTNEEIMEFCEMNFNITFPMFSKIDVNSPMQHPLFAYLTTAENEDFTGGINWNFEKFLIDREGRLQRRFRTRENPMDDPIQIAIKKLL